MTTEAATTAWQPPVPIADGPEMEALRAFHFDCEWSGQVAAGGMGPGSPVMDAIGKASYRRIMDGGWLIGDFEQDQYVAGKRIISWKAHFVIGWNPGAGEYRATYADNNGSAALLRGWIEGERFVMETLGETAVRNRLTWELLEPGEVKWRNDCSIADGPWFLVEEYVCSER